MINPTTIDIKSLPWLPLEEKASFPRKAAIYFAVDSLNNIQYIGRTKNVRTRWGSHHKYEELSTISSIRISYLFVDTPELLPEIEKALIKYFNPPLNEPLGRPNRGDEWQGSDSDGVVELRVFVPGDLRNQFKGKCATQGKNMSEIISAFMDKYVNGDISLSDLETKK